MSYRLWYSQLDVFDTARRYLAILSRWSMEAPDRDRLFVSDFYLANPSLLHQTHMSADVRRAFNELKVPKPNDCFLKYPSPPILYSRMGGIQVQALHNLVGKGLFKIALVDRDQYQLSLEGQRIVSELGSQLILPGEGPVLEFLTTAFNTIGNGKGGLRSVTGLRRMGT